MALTAVGTALLSRINPLQGTMADVRHEAADLARGEAGHVNVGANTNICEIVLAAACSALCRQSPKITLNAAVAIDAFLSVAMRKGEIDFCISPAVPPGRFSPAEFVIEPLFEISNAIFASENHRLAQRRQVSIRDLAGETWVVMRASTYQRTATHQQWQALTQLFAKHRLPQPVVGLETNSEVVMFSAVAASDYIGTVDRHCLRQQTRRYALVELPVKDKILARDLCLIHRKTAYLSPAARRLIELVKAQAREMADAPRSTRRVG